MGESKIIQLAFPRERYRLEEINLPPHLVRTLVGKTIDIRVMGEQQPRAIQFDKSDLPQTLPVLFDQDKNVWNDYWPLQIIFEDSHGRKWRIPRHWLAGEMMSLNAETPYEVTREVSWREELHLPSWWDLWDVNIESGEAQQAEGKPTVVEIHVAPRRQIHVFWRDSTGRPWRIPRDWRRRRVKLPPYDGLLANDVPPNVAKEFAGKVVSVNYHPGSLCCLPDGYRFRDNDDGRWPVRAADCVLVGYGDKDEKLA